MKMSK